MNEKWLSNLQDQIDLNFALVEHHQEIINDLYDAINRLEKMKEDAKLREKSNERN